jgi:hypothetical protein
MLPSLDVFEIENGKPMWLGCAETQAKALELVGNRGPGSYFVFSQQTGNKTFYEVVANDIVALLEDPKASSLNPKQQMLKSAHASPNPPNAVEARETAVRQLQRG